MLAIELVVSLFSFCHCLVIIREIICHSDETLLLLKLPQRFSCETWQNKVID